MDATSIKFPDEIFDAVISASTFEHIASVSSVLTEIHRVLKPGGCAFITSEPVWSYSRGHHLHHFGECSELIPPWAHLEWTPEQLREFLSDKWPSDASISLEKAIDWIYYGDELNRLNIQEYRNLFEKCPLKIEWIAHLKDNKERYKPSTLKRISDITGLSSDDLTAKGFSALLVKEL
jgi:ubiquinone/menaquinone biosynthesis C-methylase UbiE